MRRVLEPSCISLRDLDLSNAGLLKFVNMASFGNLLCKITPFTARILRGPVLKNVSGLGSVR